MDRFPSILISLILHLTVFVLLLFWPAKASDKPKIGGLVVQGYVTLGKKGSPPITPQEEVIGKDDNDMIPQERDDQPEQTPQEIFTPQAPEKSKEQADPIEIKKNSTPQELESTPPQNTPISPQEVSLPQDVQKTEKNKNEATIEVTQKEVNNTEEVKSEPLPPIDKKETNAIKEPLKEPTENSHKKPEEKPIKETKAEKKLLPEQKKEEENKKAKEDTKEPEKKVSEDKKSENSVPVSQNATAEVKSTQPRAPKETLKKKDASVATALKKPEIKADPIKEALHDIAKKTPKQQSVASNSSALESVLAGIKKETKGNTEESGTQGEGGTGIGAVTQAYAEVVGNTIKGNWAMASRADREELHATVRLFLSKSGTIEKYTMITSSGDKLFDSSLINAIASTLSIPEPPPTPNEQVIDINFYP